MIPDKAVQAAAEAIASLMEAPEGDWSEEARAALEAALPYLIEAHRPKSSTDWPDIPRRPK